MPKKTKTRRPAGRIEVRESGVHGRGVYATQFVPEGTRIIEYTGERVSWESAPNDENDPHTFNFGLESGEVINPEIGGNDARWINHCCDPNCEAIEEELMQEFECHCGAARCRGTMLELKSKRTRARKV